MVLIDKGSYCKVIQTGIEKFLLEIPRYSGTEELFSGPIHLSRVDNSVFCERVEEGLESHGSWWIFT